MTQRQRSFSRNSIPCTRAELQYRILEIRYQYKFATSLKLDITWYHKAIGCLGAASKSVQNFGAATDSCILLLYSLQYYGTRDGIAE